MEKYSIEIMYDDGSKYVINKVIRHKLDDTNFKQWPCMSYTRFSDGVEHKQYLPKRNIAAVKVKFKDSVALFRLKPCAILVAELEKNW